LNNLNYNQNRAFLYFWLNKPFQIIECDKNIGFEIISTELYDKSALDYLKSNPSYSSIHDNQLSSIVVNINNKLDTLFLNNHISKDVKKTVSINNENLVFLECLNYIRKFSVGDQFKIVLIILPQN